MQEPEESATIPVSECRRCLVFCDERGVIEHELVHGVLHFWILVSLDWEYTRVDIWSDLLESLDRILVLALSSEHCITNTSLGDRLQPRYYISDLTLIEHFCGRIFRPETPDFEYFDLGTSIDEFELVSFFDIA